MRIWSHRILVLPTRELPMGVWKYNRMLCTLLSGRRDRLVGEDRAGSSLPECSSEVIQIVSMLPVSSPFLRPRDAQRDAQRVWSQ